MLQLYLAGTIEQFWFRSSENAPGTIFLMNVESVERAKAAVDALLVATVGLMKYNLMPVVPLVPLGLLIAGK